MKTKLIILAIILIGLLLRVFFLNSSPPSLYGDELTIALDANSLLNTGRDQLGNFMPLTFEMGAGRPAGYVYFSIPFIAVFGPTPLGVRGLSILSGIGLILLIYYIGKILFSEKIGLMAAAILAVSPWDISLSRGGFEAHFALFLALLGFYLFLKAKEKPFLYFFSALSFGLTLHTYPTFKITLLLFLPLLFWFQKTGIFKIGKIHILIFLVTLFILGGLAFSQTFIGGSETRFASINVFSQQKLKDTIEEKINFERSISQLPNSIVRYFHNKPIEYMKVVGENYLQNFSMDFLFIHGDRNPRHNMATIGEFYFAEIILILLGLVSFWTRARKTILFIILWVALAPVPTAIVEFPHALRSSLMFPPLTILSALGLTTLISNKSRLVVPIVLLLLIQFVFFIQKLYFLAPNEYSNFWSYPAKIASELSLQNRSNYKYIFLSDEIDNIEFAYPVYSKTNPLTVINQNENAIKINGYSFKKFDNVYIGNIPSGNLNSFLDNLDEPVLFIGPPEAKESFDSAETITGIDDRSALIIKKITNE